MARSEYRGRTMVRDVGKCIYCGKTSAQFVLTKEHIVPHSLGGDAYLKRASCAKCQEITRDLEFHVARNIFGHFRIHSGIQTRHPEERPDELPVRVTRNGITFTKELPVKDHPLFLVLPIWDPPQIIYSRTSGGEFKDIHFNSYSLIPDHIHSVFDVGKGELVGLGPQVNFDYGQFARVIAKIAYCSAVGRFGLEAFDSFSLPQVILGQNNLIPDYVGNYIREPEPPDVGAHQHRIDTLDVTIRDGSRLILSVVRLFANASVRGINAGMPTYHVVIGRPNFPKGAHD